jgi:hypothetical protein
VYNFASPVINEQVNELSWLNWTELNKKTDLQLPLLSSIGHDAENSLGQEEKQQPRKRHEPFPNGRKIISVVVVAAAGVFVVAAVIVWSGVVRVGIGVFSVRPT